jgi:hypothetical protein
VLYKTGKDTSEQRRIEREQHMSRDSTEFIPLGKVINVESLYANVKSAVDLGHTVIEEL